MSTLPSGWNQAKLRELGVVGQPGFASGRHNRTEKGVLHLRPMNINRGGGLDLSDCRWVEDESGRRVSRGDVLFNNTNSPDLVGKTAYVSSGDAYAYSNHMTRLRVPEDTCSPQFLALHLYYLWSCGFFKSICSNHVNQASVATKRLMEVEVPVPPLDEQRRIVEILEDHLSHLDAAEAAFALAQRRLRTWQRSMIQQLTWGAAAETVRLQDLVARVEAGRSFGGPAPPARDNEWGIIKVSAMTWGEFRPDENKAVREGTIDPRYEIRPGDLLVSRANTTDYVGAPVYVERTRPRLLLSDKSLRLVPRTDVSAQWLALALASPGARAQLSAKATGTKDSMRNISQASLLSVRLPTTDLAGQKTAASRADALRLSQTNLERDLHLAAARSQALRRALLEAAFSGQLTQSADATMPDAVAAECR